MKALEKDRNRRYETVNGLARDLERYLSGDPVEAGPPSAGYRVGKLIAKYRWWVGTAAAFLVLLTIGVVVSAMMAVRAHRAEQITVAVNDSLQKALLAQASASNQAGPNTRPDPDIKVRTALDRAAEGIEGKFGAQPLVEASIRQTIGNTYKDLGLYPAAQHQVERALELRRRLLGEKESATLDSLDSLASVHWLGGRYDQAEALMKELVDRRRRLNGPEHPDTLICMNNLALIYSYEGKYPLADAMFTRTLEIRRRVSGAEHPEALSLMNNLALTYDKEGKYPDAEAMFNNALDIRRRISGPEHPETLTIMNNLGSVYHHEAQFTQAETTYGKALDARRRALGVEHPDTLIASSSLGVVRLQQQKYAEAEQTLAETLPIYERTRPATWQRYNCDSLLGAARVGQSKFAEAEPLLLAGYEGLVQRQAEVGAPNQYWLDRARAAVVDLYDRSGNAQKAAEWRARSSAGPASR
jgi:eukaryotic-like serine/threonine-protein kinase